MTNDQYIVVRLTTDGKNITWWVADDNASDWPKPIEPVRALVNRSTVAATVASAIQTELGGVSLAT